jgi:septal ring factor EnvC (AmiA/AmiB activator)
VIAAAASSELEAVAALLLLLLALLVKKRRQAAAVPPDTAGTAAEARASRRRWRRRSTHEDDMSRLNRELQTVYNDVNGLRRTQAAIEDALRQLRTDLTRLEATLNREGRLVDQLQDRHHQQLVGALDDLLVKSTLAHHTA